MKYKVTCKTCNKFLGEVIEPYKELECAACIESKFDIVVMSAPKEIGFFNEQNEWISPKVYLIERLDNCHYLIHRELAEDEIERYDKDRIFQYKSKKYLRGIANRTLKEEAKRVVRNYWSAFVDRTNNKN